ncbi:conserved hypothetical protein [delta proteobacterium NaphS2]|nr:conserved hypothetical protein [delta proteobacterium NaphS2]
MDTNTDIALFSNGTLWNRIRKTTDAALQTGALKPIITEASVMPDGGVDFLVRMVESLARKDAEKVLKAGRDKRNGENPNPFLPHEQPMFVADVSDTHLCLLNKFNVIEHHLLIVTRKFEHQETLLTVRDFQAGWRCLAEFDGLVFYNGGKVAGASQDHKHLQLIPLPMSSSGHPVPVESLMERRQENPGVIPGLPFLHAYKRFSPMTGMPHDAVGQTLHQMYRLMLQQLGMNPFSERDETLQSGPYNLLFTRGWMLLVPRSKEFFESISVNAIGFAGALLARNPEEMDLIEKKGGMEMLRHTAFARP